MSYIERAELLLRQADILLAKNKEIEDKFEFDESYANGDIIWADVQFEGSSTVYYYAFIKAANKWWSTGPRSNREGYTFEELTIWLNDRVTVKRFGTCKKIEVFRRTKKGNIKFADER